MHEITTYDEIITVMEQIVKDENKIKKFKENLWQIDNDNARNFLEGLLEEFLKYENQ